MADESNVPKESIESKESKESPGLPTKQEEEENLREYKKTFGLAALLSTLSSSSINNSNSSTNSEPNKVTSERKSPQKSEERDNLPLQKAGDSDAIKDKRLKFFCEVCTVDLNSEATFLAHVNGSKHMKRIQSINTLKELERTTDIVCDTESNTMKLVPPNPVDKIKSFIQNHVKNKEAGVLQSVLDFSTDPAVGLQYIEEYVPFSQKREPVYVCRLCDGNLVHGPALSMYYHIVGHSHRITYIRKTRGVEEMSKPEVIRNIEEIEKEDGRQIHLIKTICDDSRYPWSGELPKVQGTVVIIPVKKSMGGDGFGGRDDRWQEIEDRSGRRRSRCSDDQFGGRGREDDRFESDHKRLRSDESIPSLFDFPFGKNRSSPVENLRNSSSFSDKSLSSQSDFNFIRNDMRDFSTDNNPKIYGPGMAEPYPKERNYGKEFKKAEDFSGVLNDRLDSLFAGNIKRTDRPSDKDNKSSMEQRFGSDNSYGSNNRRFDNSDSHSGGPWSGKADKMLEKFPGGSGYNDYSGPGGGGVNYGGQKRSFDDSYGISAYKEKFDGMNMPGNQQMSFTPSGYSGNYGNMPSNGPYRESYQNPGSFSGYPSQKTGTGYDGNSGYPNQYPGNQQSTSCGGPPQNSNVGYGGPQKNINIGYDGPPQNSNVGYDSSQQNSNVGYSGPQQNSNTQPNQNAGYTGNSLATARITATHSNESGFNRLTSSNMNESGISCVAGSNLNESGFNPVAAIHSNESGFNRVIASQSNSSVYNPVAANQSNNSGCNPVAATQSNNSGYNPVAATQLNNSGYNPVATTQSNNSGYNPVVVPQSNNSGYNPVVVPQSNNSGYNSVAATQSNNSGYNPVAVPQSSNSGYNPVAATHLNQIGFNPVAATHLNESGFNPVTHSNQSGFDPTVAHPKNSVFNPAAVTQSNISVFNPAVATYPNPSVFDPVVAPQANNSGFNQVAATQVNKSGFSQAAVGANTTALSQINSIETSAAGERTPSNDSPSAKPSSGSLSGSFQSIINALADCPVRNDDDCRIAFTVGAKLFHSFIRYQLRNDKEARRAMVEKFNTICLCVNDRDHMQRFLKKEKEIDECLKAKETMLQQQLPPIRPQIPISYPPMYPGYGQSMPPPFPQPYPYYYPPNRPPYTPPNMGRFQPPPPPTPPPQPPPPPPPK